VQKVGVEAVVEGLGAFISDMGLINRSMDQLRPQGTLLQRMFEGVGEGLRSFGREVLNVAEVALGVILARAIEFVVSGLKEMISATIQAGAEFQIMSLRLNRLNFNDVIEAGGDMATAMDVAKDATKEQLSWIQKLAIQTPYDAADISNVYTMARAYGFADDMARELTITTTDFTASMGLGDIEMRRILKNFGQMTQLGKITQRELNDLAVGALVPVNDVLARMRENTGLQGAAFDKLKASGEGVNEFFKAFTQIVEERAGGAAADMARTFSGATANVKDFIQSLLGVGVVMPVLSAVGGKLADFVTSLTESKNWDALTAAADRVGGHLTLLVESVLGLIPSTEDLAGGITAGLNKVADWIATHHYDILNFFKGIGTTIQTRVVPFIKRIVDGFNTIRDWVSENKELIGSFFKTLGEIIGTVFENLTGGKLPAGGGLEGFLGAITTFMQTVIANKDAIAEWATTLTKVFLALQGIGTVLNIVIGVVVAILAPILAFLAVLAGLVGIWTILGPLLLAVGGFIVTVLVPAFLLAGAIFIAIIAIIALVVGALFSIYLTVITVQQKIEEFAPMVGAKFTEIKDQAVANFEELKTMATAKFEEFKANVTAKLTEFVAIVKGKIEIVKGLFLDAPWGRIGRLIIEGITVGVLQAVSGLIAAVVSAVNKAFDAAMNAIGAQSPSKLFMQVGDYAMQGMAKGITTNAKLAVGAMQEAVSAMSMPALGLPTVVQQYAVGMGPSVNSNTTTTNNFSLTVNSGAPTEPMIQDYNMMQSLVQG
jgi:hypothetical protein